MAPTHIRIPDCEASKIESPISQSGQSPNKRGEFARKGFRKYHYLIMVGVVFIIIGLAASFSNAFDRKEETKQEGMEVSGVVSLNEKVADAGRPEAKRHGTHGAATGPTSHSGKSKNKGKQAKGENKDTDTPWMSLPNPMLFRKARKEAVINEELKYPEERRSPLTLTLQETILPTPWVGGHFATRGYGSIPGPTIRVRPGETLEINIENKLGEGPGYKSCHFDHADLGFFMNPATICALNHTNLHTHGLHVSSNQPGDSIFNHVEPGGSMTIKIPVPKNHMGGTHWYHPHLHHATAAQAGGGAHGAIIVDDPMSSLPIYVQNMPERLMFLSLVNIAKSMRLESWGLGTLENYSIAEQKLWTNPTYPHWRWAPFSGTLAEHGEPVGLESIEVEPELVINGQWKPKITIEEGVWHRFRFVFASIEQRVEIYPQGHKFGAAYCQYQLLAKDGVYLHEAPRPIHRIYLVSGSRADVAVSCTCGFLQRPCHTHLNFEAKWQPMGIGSMAITMESSGGELLRIETGFGKKLWDWSTEKSELQRFSVRRPCYLADLRRAEVPAQNHHSVDLPQLYPMKVTFDGKGTVWGHETPEPMVKVKVGEVQEWTLSGIRFHPFHTHVNPYQVVQIWNDPYYQPGDWHDTMLPVGSGTAKVRVNLDKFTGKMIAHCHLLEHEDNGMMGFIQIEGREGSTWDHAHLLDPQCYDDYFPGPPVPDAPPIWR